VTELVGNASTVRVKVEDWEATDRAAQWLRDTAAAAAATAARSSPPPRRPFALYLGLNLPHTYKTKSLGPTGGGSTFRTSPYWLKKVRQLSARTLSILEGNLSAGCCCCCCCCCCCKFGKQTNL